MREQPKAPPNGTSSGTFMRECPSEPRGDNRQSQGRFGGRRHVSFETCRPALNVSAYRAGPEVTSLRSERRF
jgi:hypothetical protein